MSNVQVRVTRNFRRNLDEIEAFLAETESAAIFSALLDDLFSRAIPLLESHPAAGRNFFRHPPGSRESSLLATSLQQRLGTDTSLRELVRGNYLLLYAQRDRQVFLLAIRHHRQLCFDFYDRWWDG